VPHWSTRRWIPSAKKVLGCVRSWYVRCTHTSMTKITTPSENCSTWHTLSPIHIPYSIVNVGSTNTFCRQKLDYCAQSLFGGIHGTIVSCYLASASVNNTLPLSSIYQISPDIHCHLPGKSQSSTAGNNGAPTSVPLSLGHALYVHICYQYALEFYIFMWQKSVSHLPVGTRNFSFHKNLQKGNGTQTPTFPKRQLCEKWLPPSCTEVREDRIYNYTLRSAIV